MPIDHRIQQIAAHDASVGSNPELSHATFHVQAIINHHQSVTSCTIHNSPSFESLMLPMISIGECASCMPQKLWASKKQLTYEVCMTAENEER
jgi:hypothetical protein